MPDSDLIHVADADGVTTIVMDDGKANVMTLAMLTALDEAIVAAADAEQVIVLAGRPGLFSGGYDMGMFNRSEREILDTLRAGGNLIHRILGCPVPIVIACTGHAIAQGSFILLAADVRIGPEDGAKFGLNEVAIGLTIPHYGVEVARHRLTPPGLIHATGTGSLYPPDEAHRLGFLDRLVPADEVLPAADEAAHDLTQIDFTAHAGTKARTRRDCLETIRRLHDEEFPARG